MKTIKRFYSKLLLVLALLLCFCGCARQPELIGVGREVSKEKPVLIPTQPALIEAKPALPIRQPDIDFEPQATYTNEELEILALIIYQEAGGDACLDSTRQMVGEVFLNRVASSQYPNTFYDVAIQEAQYGRLHWTGIVWPERANLPQEQHAVERAYNIARDLLSGNANRLLPSGAIYQAEFEQGSITLKFQDGFYFCM